MAEFVAITMGRCDLVSGTSVLCPGESAMSPGSGRDVRM